MNKRRAILVLSVALALVVAVPLIWTVVTSLRFPSDRTPRGAYLRIAISLGKGDLKGCFPYLETEAQDAVYSIRDFRAQSLRVVRERFREPEKSLWISQYAALAQTDSPAATWAVIAKARGWDKRLRRDLSGIQRVEKRGDRATVQTLHGTRYTFRRARNGIWGLTMFTPELLAMKERAARDWKVIQHSTGSAASPSSNSTNP